jgi:hypothetical protein
MSKWFKRSSKRHTKPPVEEKTEQKTRHPKKSKEKSAKDATVGQGLVYFYVIIGSQLVFVLGLVAFITGIGKILATPWWIFFFAFLLLTWGCIYLFRKVKSQLGKFRDAVKEIDLGDQSCEISVMGGLLTMRVEQNSQRLLEAPSVPPVLEAESVETRAQRGN